MRILIFGGAFDPPHLGHLQLLREALGLEFFEQIWLIPTFIPPLKMTSVNNDSVASPEDRLEMCRLLIDNLQRHCHSERSEESHEILRPMPQNDIKILDLEIKRGGKSYTIETVRVLKKRNPKDQFYFLIGSDWVKDLPKWHKAEELLEEIEFIALPRTKISSSKIREKIKNGQSIKSLVPEEIEEYIKKHKSYV